MLDFRITLEARNPARRCLRQYRVEAGTDLFGVWVVEITYGRIGTAGRSRSYVVRDEGEARHLARSILKRRASAAPHRGRVPHPRAGSIGTENRRQVRGPTINGAQGETRAGRDARAGCGLIRASTDDQVTEGVGFRARRTRLRFALHNWHLLAASLPLGLERRERARPAGPYPRRHDRGVSRHR